MSHMLSHNETKLYSTHRLVAMATYYYHVSTIKLSGDFWCHEKNRVL